MSKVLPSKSALFRFIIVSLLSANAVAEEGDSYLESSHQSLSNELVRLADSIDRIFGEPRATDQTNRTSLRLRTNYDWTGRGDDETGTEVRLNLRLPILERETKKLRYDSEKTNSPSTPIVAEENGPIMAPIERDILDRLRQKKRWHLRAEPGVRVNDRVSFFEKARATKSFFTGKVVHNFSQEVTWDTDTLWEENTLIESDYAISDKFLLRLLNQADWQISDSKFFSDHGPSLIQKIDLLSAFSYNARVMSQVRHSRWFADSYTLSVNYRRAVYSNWAFLELTPALIFEKEQRFKGMTNLTARLEFLFGAI